MRRAGRPGLKPSSIFGAAGFDARVVGDVCGLADLDRVPVRSAPGWMQLAWAGRVSAMALPWAIYVSPGLLAADDSRVAHLLVHELVHVRQWQDLGRLRFIGRYLCEYFSNRRRGLTHPEAYWAISFEQEARRLAGE